MNIIEAVGAAVYSHSKPQIIKRKDGDEIVCLRQFNHTGFCMELFRYVDIQLMHEPVIFLPGDILADDWEVKDEWS